MQAISSGDVYGAVVNDVFVEQWVVVDFLARVMAGEQPDPELQNPVMVLTPDNVDDAPDRLPFPGFPEAYMAAWGVS